MSKYIMMVALVGLVGCGVAKADVMTLPDTRGQISRLAGNLHNNPSLAEVRRIRADQACTTLQYGNKTVLKCYLNNDTYVVYSYEGTLLQAVFYGTDADEDGCRWTKNNLTTLFGKPTQHKAFYYWPQARHAVFYQSRPGNVCVFGVLR